MLATLIEKVRTAIAIRRLNSFPIVQDGRLAIDSCWTNHRDLVKDFSLPFVHEQATKMMDSVIAIAVSPDPRMANRQRLTECVLELAQFQVLVMEPPPVPDPTGLRDQPGITGELRAHLVELAHKDRGLKEFMHSFEAAETWDDVWNPVLMRYRLLHAWTHVYNNLRSALNDVNPTKEKDWFRPFLAAMCAWQEHDFRKTLGMPPALPTKGKLDADLHSMMMSSFMNRVLSGVRFPDLEWRHSMAEFETT